jgi:hypothetical protein
MKIRGGFVSNSSTSSFCIYGAELGYLNCDMIELMQRCEKIAPKEYEKFWHGHLLEAKKRKDKDAIKIFECIKDIGNPKWFGKEVKIRACNHQLSTKAKFCPQCGKPIWLEEPLVNEDDVYETISDLSHEFFEEFVINREGYDSEYFGKTYDGVADDVTFGEFRKETQRLLSALAGKKVKCEYISSTD